MASSCLPWDLRLGGAGILFLVVQITSEGVKSAKNRQGGIFPLALALGIEDVVLVKTFELFLSGADIYLSLYESMRCVMCSRDVSG